MRILITFILLAVGGDALAQKDNPQINQIRARFQSINNATDYKILSINSDQYSEITGVYTDGGIEAIGFVKNKKIFKIVETGFTSSIKLTTEYYFWDNLLIFIYSKTEQASYDSVTTALDFNTLTKIAESRLYIRNSKLIKRADNGSGLYYFDPEKKAGARINSPDKLKNWFLKMCK